MFTGIIETIAKIEKSQQNEDILRLTIQRPQGWDLKLGQSIAHDGVCLTVTRYDDTTYDIELMPETYRRTTFRPTNLPQSVNLERAMRADAMFEGHVVQGHVDAVVDIVKIGEDAQWRTLFFTYPSDKENLLVDKGSITIDGISLTVVDVLDDTFSVSLIPHTITHTTLGKKKVGDIVNIEYDIIGKYIAKHLKNFQK